MAPPELRTNLNRLVILSLQEYVSRRRRQEFASAVAAMAGDPQVQAECAAIARDFAVMAGNEPEPSPSLWFRATPSTVSRS